MSKNSIWQRLSLIGAICLISTLTFGSDRSLAQEDKPDWEYGGSANPTHWDELSPEYKSCKLGNAQSPINIDSYQEGEPTKIEFNYQPTTGEVIDNGHTIQVNYEPGSTAKIGNEVYELKQFHFHTPSEHRIDDEASAMEAHFVHQNEAGELAVVGVMMTSGAENPVIASIWDAIPNRNKQQDSGEVSLNAANLLPGDKTYWSYTGSLTTPPCSEGVSWNLLSEPIELSPEQIATFESIYSYNARPIEPLDGRSVEFHPAK